MPRARRIKESMRAYLNDKQLSKYQKKILEKYSLDTSYVYPECGYIRIITEMEAMRLR